MVTERPSQFEVITWRSASGLCAGGEGAEQPPRPPRAEAADGTHVSPIATRHGDLGVSWRGGTVIMVARLGGRVV